MFTPKTPLLTYHFLSQVRLPKQTNVMDIYYFLTIFNHGVMNHGVTHHNWLW